MKNLQNLIFKKYGLYSLLSLSAVLVFLISTTLLIPSIKDILQKKETLAEKKTQLANLTKKRTLLESVTSPVTLKNLEDAEIALPSTKDASTILIALENLAQDTGLGIDAINLSPGLVSTSSANPTSEKTVVTQGKILHKGAEVLPVTLQTRGTSEQLADFLKKLLTSRRLFEIEDVVMSAVTDSPNFFTAQFSLLSYYLSPIDKIGDIESELPQLTSPEQDLLSSLKTYPNRNAVPQAEVAGVGGGSSGKENLFGQ